MLLTYLLGLQAFIPIKVEMCVPLDYHGHIIGPKGALIRQLMDDHSVNISIPPASLKSEVITIEGSPANAEAACNALKSKICQFEEERRLKVTAYRQHL